MATALSRLTLLAVAAMIGGCGQQHDVVDVLVPKADIPQGTKIDVRKMFTIKAFPKGELPANVVTDPMKLEGRFLARSVRANSPITQLDFVEPDFRKEIEPGYTHVTVGAVFVDPAFQGFISPGDRVDVIEMIRSPEQADQPLPEPYLQRIKVLTSRPLGRTENRQSNLSATLMVKSDQVEKLLQLSNRGQIALIYSKPD